MTESDIGISVFLTKAKGIGGRLKKNPEDFVVNELSIFPEMKDEGAFTAAVLMSRGRVHFAGTKDKRAVTTQLFVIQASPKDVQNLKIPDVEVLEAYRTDKRIMLGDLLGNEFEIAIRDIPVAGEDVKKSVSSVRNEIIKTGGFPNFFGIQRFGAIRPITHLVGKAIIMGDFEGAVKTYVANPVEGESPAEFEARKALEESGDYGEALRTYPKTLSFEKAILNHLVKHEDDFVGALYQLPKNLLMMFVHSYQSYVFNLALSERLRSGMPMNEPIEGDLVLAMDKRGLPDRDRWIEAGPENIEKLGKRCSEGKAFVSGALFGSKSILAKGEMGELERTIIEKEDLRPKDFIIPKMPELSSEGTRRELLASVKEIDVQVLEDRVVLRFKLTKGCYATSLLREFLKSGDFRDY
jgi:tRNA pseudouridine13 synthase